MIGGGKGIHEVREGSREHFEEWVANWIPWIKLAGFEPIDVVNMETHL